MMGEEGAVIGGLLVGLNVIDCNICIKGGDLDVQVCVSDQTDVSDKKASNFCYNFTSLQITNPLNGGSNLFEVS